MKRIVKLGISIGVSFGAGAVGLLATIPNLPTWYATLAKPAFNPPNWIFGPVWTLLYLLMGISLYLAWTVKYARRKRAAFVAFGLQLALNILWPLVFFGLHSIVGGNIVIFALLVTIITMAFLFWKITKTAAYLLIPYILWVGFALILNTSIALINIQ